MKRGWISLDLHMHGKGSAAVDPGRIDSHMTAEQFVETLSNNGIELFSVTDHMVFDAQFYDDLETAIRGREMALVYGVELNVYLNVERLKQAHPEKEIKGHPKFQMGAYFPPGTNKQALQKAMISLYGDPQSASFPQKYPELHDITAELFRLNCSFLLVPEANKSSGINNLDKQLSKGDLQILFKDMMYRFFNGYDATEKWSDQSMDIWALELYKNTQAIESLFNELSPKEVEEKIRSLYSLLSTGGESNDSTVNDVLKTIRYYARNFPYFHFSDWHCAENFIKHGENYVFGSLDRPFETIRIAMCDPYSRVRLCPVGQSIAPKPEYLREVSFLSHGQRCSITLQPGLNAIIGKRASGKSMLLSAIGELCSVPDKQSSSAKYANTGLLDVSTISAITYGNRIVKRGQLPSVERIDQNSIKTIFEETENASKIFSDLFPALPSVPKNDFVRLQTEAQNLKPFVKSYGSVSDYIFSDDTNSDLSFSLIKDLLASDFEGKQQNLLSLFDDVIASLQALGLSSLRLEEAKKQTTLGIDAALYQIELFKDIIDCANELIANYTRESERNHSKNLSANKTLAEFYKGVSTNFNTLLSFLKFRRDVENFSPHLPDPKCKKFDGYVFVSYYKTNDTELRDKIKDAIVSTINKSGLKRCTDGWELLRLYLNGSTRLNDRKASLADNLNDKFWNEEVSLVHKLLKYKGVPLDLSGTELVAEIGKDPTESKVISVSDSSLGEQSSSYLEILLKRSDASIMLFDQPEDNIDNDYISRALVPMMKEKKLGKQMIFVTHNPSVAVYADAFTYILAKNEGDKITYKNLYLEDFDSRDEIVMTLDGGPYSFSNRNRKYRDVIGEYEWKQKDYN